MSNVPIACTLGPAAVEARREDLLGGLVRRAEERIDVPNGYRVRFTPAKDILATIASVVDLERQCCRFLRFHLTLLAFTMGATSCVGGPVGIPQSISIDHLTDHSVGATPLGDESQCELFRAGLTWIRSPATSSSCRRRS